MNINPFAFRGFAASNARPGWCLDIENDRNHDGVLVGASRTFLGDSDTAHKDAFVPSNGKLIKGDVVMVNGIMTDLDLQRADLQAMANLGYRVVGIHNATAGLMADLGQCVQDKLDLGDNKAVDTAADMIRKAVFQDKPLHLVGHSQGALIVSRALGRVTQEIVADGLTREQAAQSLAHIQVTSLGGAAWTYPEGPTYHHFYNDRDIVPTLMGRGFPGKFFDNKKESLHPFSQVRESGELPDWSKSVGNRIARYTDATTHGAREVYLPALQGAKTESSV